MQARVVALCRHYNVDIVASLSLRILAGPKVVKVLLVIAAPFLTRESTKSGCLGAGCFFFRLDFTSFLMGSFTPGCSQI